VGQTSIDASDTATDSTAISNTAAARGDDALKVDEGNETCKILGICKY